jgi:hypothetical protein
MQTSVKEPNGDQITAAIAILGKAVEEMRRTGLTPKEVAHTLRDAAKELSQNEHDRANYARLANQTYKFLEQHCRD